MSSSVKFDSVIPFAYATYFTAFSHNRPLQYPSQHPIGKLMGIPGILAFQWSKGLVDSLVVGWKHGHISYLEGRLICQAYRAGIWNLPNSFSTDTFYP